MKYEGMPIDTDFNETPLMYKEMPSKERFTELFVKYALTFESRFDMAQIISYRDRLYAEKSFVFLLSAWNECRENYEKERLGFLCCIPDIIECDHDTDISCETYFEMREVKALERSMESLQYALDLIVGCYHD